MKPSPPEECGCDSQRADALGEGSHNDTSAFETSPGGRGRLPPLTLGETVLQSRQFDITEAFYEDDISEATR